MVSDPSKGPPVKTPGAFRHRRTLRTGPLFSHDHYRMDDFDLLRQQRLIPEQAPQRSKSRKPLSLNVFSRGGAGITLDRLHRPAGGVGTHVLPIFHIRHRPTPAAFRAGHPLWLILLLPAYWPVLWASLGLALSDLARDPAHWRKTEHGAAPRPASNHVAQSLI